MTKTSKGRHTVTPRKASLRVAHQAKCPKANATTIASLKGCKCKPSYYTLHRGRDGRTIKSARVKTRKAAQDKVNELQVDIDRGRLGQRRPSQLTFSEWADQFEANTESRVRSGDLKPRTAAGYRETIALARLSLIHI